MIVVDMSLVTSAIGDRGRQESVHEEESESA